LAEVIVQGLSQLGAFALLQGDQRLGVLALMEN